MMTEQRRDAQSSESAFWQAYLPSRYAILFYSLLLMLVAIPMAATIGLPQRP